MTLSEPEKVILVHTVVEASATRFYRHVRPAMKVEKDPHFAHHDVVDHDHQNLGLDLLESLSEEEFVRLERIQFEGWKMLNVVMNRIAELTEASLPTMH